MSFFFSSSTFPSTLTGTAEISTIADCGKVTQNEFVLVDE
jgi:hypothetical protein